MMPSRYNRKKAKQLSEIRRRMAKARWAKEDQRKLAEMPAIARQIAEVEVENLLRRHGDALGSLQWTEYRTGRVRRWIVRIGRRRDQITVEAPGGIPTGSHGLTWLTTKLRKSLSS